VRIAMTALLLVCCHGVTACISYGAWRPSGVSPEQAQNLVVVRKRPESWADIRYIDGARKDYEGFFSKFDRYELPPGRHTFGVRYTDMGGSVHTFSEAILEIEFDLQAGNEYELEANVGTSTWEPVVKDRSTGRVVSRLNGKTYENP
jgi:hypothetical protein